MLQTKNITRKSKDYRQIRDFMERSFPKYELLPMWVLIFSARKKFVKFEAYYEDNKFVGITYQIFTTKMNYVLYLAINDEIQSKGYGSKILQKIIADNKNKVVILDIEELDKNSKNYEQRKRRFNFYLKNGLKDTGFEVLDGNTYRVLATQQDVDINELKKIFQKYSLGLYRYEIKEVNLIDKNQL